MNRDSTIEIEDAPAGQCPRCRVRLVEGEAFTQPPIPVLDVTTDIDFTAKLVACLKCPTCGYSEELQDDIDSA